MPGKTLITGGSGFIGTNLVAAMVAEGEDLLSLDKAPALCPGHERYRRPCDIMDADVLCEAMRAYAPDRVMHLAARTDLEESEGLAAYRENIQGTTNVLNAIRATPSVKRAVITSSSLASRPGYIPESDRDYRPHTRYGESKAVSEELTRAAQLPCTWFILRPTTIWGPWLMRHRDEVFKTMRRGLYLHPGGAPVMRAWGYVGNSVVCSSCRTSSCMRGSSISPTSAATSRTGRTSSPVGFAAGTPGGFRGACCARSRSAATSSRRSGDPRSSPPPAIAT